MIVEGTEVTLSSSERNRIHTAPIHPTTDSSVNVWRGKQAGSRARRRLQTSQRAFVPFFFFFFFFLPRFNQSALPPIHLKKATLPETMPDKIITDMKVKHVTDCHESDDSSQRHCLGKKKPAVLLRIPISNSFHH